jgi:dimethylamine/trimethylamine dehydrogenase
MVSAIRRGVLDLIGAARPSIADPFLPNKVKEGRLDEIRECIGCNICVTGDTRFVPIRCTQNPTMGEEWRRSWHPELIAPKKSEAEIMVVGAGPAGLECALSLGQRGYQVTLLEARRELGGRVLRESALPGLSEWRRVAEWRLTRLAKMPNVGLYPSSPMTAAEILETGIPHAVLATGATYRRDGRGRTIHHPIPGHALPAVFTPEDLMDGRLPSGRVILYDDDHFYLGGLLAELLAQNGCDVTLVTPAPLVSYWTQFTLEQSKIQTRLMKLGVKLFPQTLLSEIQPASPSGTMSVHLTHALSGEVTVLPCDAVLLVTDRISNDSLYYELKPALAEGRLQSLRLIGDAEAPNIIAQAVFSGHLAAREFDEEPVEGTPFKIERIYP